MSNTDTTLEVTGPGDNEILETLAKLQSMSNQVSSFQQSKFKDTRPC